ncbi:MAG: hypothetical protein P8X89_08660 [Reinekea sp.]
MACALRCYGVTDSCITYLSLWLIRMLLEFGVSGHQTMLLITIFKK